MHKKPTLYIILGILLPLLLTGCGGGGSAGSGGSDDVTASYTDTVYAPRHALGFRVTAPERPASDHATPLLVSVFNPWQGADDTCYRLLILPEGSDASAVPAGFDGSVITGSAKRIVAMSSTHVAMLDAIGAADRIVGISGLDFISSAQVAKRRDEIADIGYEGNIDYEVLAGAHPDLVLLYGVNAASSMEPKLRELGIPFIYIGDYLEQSPLGKAEWMLALGAITGRMHHAARTFAPVEKSYEQTANLVGSFARKPYPKVMVNAPQGDGWLMPPTGSYIARLIADAGGDCLYKENTGNSSRPIDMERSWALMSQADVWLNPGAVSSMEQLIELAPRMADTPPVKNGNVWNNNNLTTPGGGNDFYESGTVRPDIVLLDLVRILHPELSDSTSTTVYYHRLK